MSRRTQPWRALGALEISYGRDWNTRGYPGNTRGSPGTEARGIYIPLGAPCWTWVGCWTSRQYLTSRSIGSGDITAAKHEFLSLRAPLAGGAISSPRHVGRVPVCPQSCIFFAALYRAPTLERRRTGEMVMRCEEWLFGTSNRSTRSGFRVTVRNT